MTSSRRTRWIVPAATAATLLVAGLGATAAFADDSSTPAHHTNAATSASNTNASTNAAAPYGYGPSALTDCFDDRSVPYRQEDTPEGHALTPLGTNNPTIAKAIQTCSDITTRPATASGTAYRNQVTATIATCLRHDGYTIDTSGGEMTDGGGRSILTFTAQPATVRTDPAYTAALNDCTAQAQSSVPSPAPTK